MKVEDACNALMHSELLPCVLLMLEIERPQTDSFNTASEDTHRITPSLKKLTRSANHSGVQSTVSPPACGVSYLTAAFRKWVGSLCHASRFVPVEMAAGGPHAESEPVTARLLHLQRASKRSSSGEPLWGFTICWQDFTR